MKSHLKVLLLSTLLASCSFVHAAANNNCNGRDSCSNGEGMVLNNSAAANAGALALSSSSSHAVGVGLGGSSSATGGNASASGGNANVTNNTSGGNSNSSNSIAIDNDTKMPVSPAFSPSVGTASDCQIATPSSKAVSVMFISLSGTTGVTYNDVCFALKTGDVVVAKKLMCDKSSSYKKANAEFCGK